MNRSHVRVLGIDGGGTRTRFVVADGHGRLLGHHLGSSINLDDVSFEQARRHLTSAIADVRRATGHEGPFTAAFFGSGGVLTQRDRDDVRRLSSEAGVAPPDRTGVHHDAFVALEAGLNGRPGLVVVAGTGSICFGRDANGQEAKCGNWGPSLGDEGSGHWLGREALRATVHASDGRRPFTRLAEATLAWLGIDHPDALLRRVHEPDLTRSAIAAFAPTVIALADEGDPVARDVLRSGAEALADVIAVVHSNLFASGRTEAVMTGGLALDVRYRRALHDSVAARAPDLTWTPPALPPVLGAVRRALMLAGVSIDATTEERLSRDATTLPPSF